MDINDLVEIISDYSNSIEGRTDKKFMKEFKPYKKGNKENYVRKLLISDALSTNLLTFIVDQTVSEGDIFRYSSGSERSDGEGGKIDIRFTKEIVVNQNFLNDIYNVSKLGAAMILTALGEEKDVFNYDDYDGDLTGSDIQDNMYNNDVYGDVMLIGNVKAREGLGFFIKQLPLYDKIISKFNFNDNDDNLFCPFTAIYKQDKDNLLPKIDNTRNSFYEIYRRCGFEASETFQLSKNDMFRLYESFCKQYSLNMQLKVYYYKNHDCDIKYEKKDLKDFSNKKKTFIYGNGKVLKFSVARVRGHIFNILGGQCTIKVEYLRYLEYVNCHYNSLPYKEKDIKKLSRESAREYNEYVRSKTLNPDQLLKDADSRLETLYHKDEIEEIDNIEPYVFLYDLETVNDEKSKFWIYSYYIKCIKKPKNDIDLIPDDFHIHFRSDVIKIVKLKDGTEVRIIDSCIIKMMNYLITHLPNNAKAILFAHNGSNFDNIIFRELMMSSFGFSDIKEVCTGQNQGILLSLDFTYTYYNHDGKGIYPVPKDVMLFREKKSVNVSLRDSKKIINYPVKNLSSAFNVKAYKLPYDYDFYQKFVIDHDHNRITSYRLKRLFKSDIPYFNDFANEKHIIEDMSKYFTQKFIKQYINIINGKYLDKLEDGDFKKDIIDYLYKLKEDGKYYDIINYCFLYNKYDVLVVEQAMHKFQTYITALEDKQHMVDMIKKEVPDKAEELISKLPENKVDYIKGASEIDIYRFRSLASIVYDLCVKYGVYDNIYELRGDLKLFIQLAVVGGRVMCGGADGHKMKNYNKVKAYEELVSYVGKESTPELDEKISNLLQDGILDFDAVSLYPSAIYITHMPAGKPKIIDLSNKEISKTDLDRVVDKLLNNNKKFFICCDIETKKDIRYPILSEINESGRNFRNGKFEKIVIGDQTLKDVIRYQDAVIIKLYTIVIFPEKCDKFSNMIKCLFNLRLLLKKLRLPCQETVKTLMNSAYGRTILKQSHYKSSYFKFATQRDKTRFNNFLSKNFHVIKPEINCYGTIYKKVNKKDSSDIKGYPHIGAAILETSKSLMYKAFDLLDYNVFYTDTDSMHILASDINKVKSLIGSDMCQFHSDFDPSTKKSPVRGLSSNGITAIQSVFVMKKCYYDELFCVDIKSNKYCIREHKRVKGLPSEFMDKEKYIKLINGETLECDLNMYCNMLTRKNKNGELVKLNKFTRKIKMN